MKVEIEWIPCAERLPDADERVLIVADGDVWGATYEDGPDVVWPRGWITDDGTPVDPGFVKHWARMPEVPT